MSTSTLAAGDAPGPSSGRGRILGSFTRAELGRLAGMAAAATGADGAFVVLFVSGMPHVVSRSGAVLDAMADAVLTALFGAPAVTDVVADVRTAPARAVGAEGLRSVACVPFPSPDATGLLGGVAVVHREPHRFKTGSVRHLESMCRGVMLTATLRRTTVELERAVRQRDAALAELRDRGDAQDAELSARNTELGQLAERVGSAFFSLDRAWRFRYVNTQAAALVQREARDLLGRHVLTELPAFVNSPIHRAMERAAADQAPSTFELHIPQFGHWYATRVYPSADGLSVFLAEITSLHEARETALTNEMRLHLAVEAAGIGLWDWDLLTNAVYFSPEWKAMLGFEDHEIANAFAEFETRTHPDDLPRVMARVQQHLASPDGEYAIEFRMRHRDGIYRWIFTRAAVLRDAAARPIRMLGCHVDVSAQKRAQESLQTSHEELRRLSAALMDAREQERARIAREVHDDLGQLLTALRLDIARMRRRVSLGDTDVTGGLEQADAALQDLTARVRRIASDLRPGVLDDLGLAAALDWQAKDFESHTHVACRTVVRLAVDPPGAVATALFRIAQESLTNVARHARASTVVIRLTEDDDAWRLHVVDDGVGMASPETAGLASAGLAGMRERAHLMGGDLVIDSMPGQGTMIRVRLPRHGGRQLERRETR